MNEIYERIGKGMLAVVVAEPQESKTQTRKKRTNHQRHNDSEAANTIHSFPLFLLLFHFSFPLQIFPFSFT